MANIAVKYPDFSKPLKQATPAYPDFSKPIQKQDNWKYPNYPFAGGLVSPEENKIAMQQAREGLKGASQSYLNTPEEAANAFGGHLYNKFNYASNTQAAKIGGTVGDIASYFQPEGMISGGVKLASLIPKVAKAVEGGGKALKAKPVVNWLLNLGKNTGEAALFEKEKNPEASKADVVKAGGLGGLITAASTALVNKNPLIATAARLGLGGALGYQAQGIPGIGEGMIGAAVAPKILSELGMGSKPVSAEFLASLNQNNPTAKAKYEAANAINAPIRPSEAFNNPPTAAREGHIGDTEEGANAMAEHADQRVAQQKSAINKLLNTIYPKTKKSANAIRDLYAKSYTNNLPKETLNKLLEDPLIARAKEEVKADPVYQRKLKDINEDNFAYLDQMKRKLGADAKQAARRGDDVAATQYTNAKNNLVKEMDKVDDTYKAARDASQLKIVRKQIEKGLGSKPINGNTFFSQFLANDNKYNKLLSDLSNAPEATEQVKNMKIAWEDLVGRESVKSRFGSAAKKTDTDRNKMDYLWTNFKNLFGANRDIERANFIHDPKWWDKFDEVMAYKDKLKRREELANLVSRGITAGALEYGAKKGRK